MRPQVRDAIEFLKSLLDGGHADSSEAERGGGRGRHADGGSRAKILVFCHHQSVLDAIENKLLKVGRPEHVHMA